MDIRRTISELDQKVRTDFVPAKDYVSREFMELENERLWPYVWQMACREEEIPRIGDFVTYDILDDSIIVMRAGPGADDIKAYHNACPHRGRRLTQGCGHNAHFHCRFHGWQFDLHGKPIRVVDREDWGGALQDEDISLMSVKVGRWGGWVYINMDPDSESLEDALAPATTFLDPYDLGGLRYHWRKTAIMPCNWKTALEAFSEAYHVQQVHQQVLKYMDDIPTSRAFGRHGMFDYSESMPPGLRSRRLGGAAEGDDVRVGLVAYMEESCEQLKGAVILPMVEPARRVLREVPAGAPLEEAFSKLFQFGIEDAAARGIEHPSITPEQMYAGGTDWHLFPNQVILQTPMSLLGYRARPVRDDPHSCIFDVYSLLRYAPGSEPEVEHEFTDDLASEEIWGKILVQDFENFAAVQEGMKSRGFRGARPNPKQEIAVSNFHRALYDFMDL